MLLGLLAGEGVLSFSPIYFRREFGLPYEVWTPPSLEVIKPTILEKRWRGFNVTTPYKEAILPLLDRLTPPCDQILAVNTVVIELDGTWVGYNTDYEAARILLPTYEAVYGPWEEVWVLGTGGAARAVALAHLETWPAIPLTFLSRTPEKPNFPFPTLAPIQRVSYEAATKLPRQGRRLIIQATPIGSYPHMQATPPFPFHTLQPDDIVWDLIYNPNPSRFLQIAHQLGSHIESGMALLKWQANLSVQYWFAVHKAVHLRKSAT